IVAPISTANDRYSQVRHNYPLNISGLPLLFGVRQLGLAASRAAIGLGRGTYEMCRLHASESLGEVLRSSLPSSQLSCGTACGGTTTADVAANIKCSAHFDTERNAPTDSIPHRKANRFAHESDQQWLA